MQHVRAPEGRKSTSADCSFAPAGLKQMGMKFAGLGPTACAVGYGLSPLPGLFCPREWLVGVCFYFDAPAGVRRAAPFCFSDQSV